LKRGRTNYQSHTLGQGKKPPFPKSDNIRAGIGEILKLKNLKQSPAGENTIRRSSGLSKKRRESQKKDVSRVFTCRLVKGRGKQWYQL